MDQHSGFYSILWRSPEEEHAHAADRQPDCFPDLRLDQVVHAALRDPSEVMLEFCFWRPLQQVDAVVWRQATVRDLQREPLHHCVDDFCTSIRSMREMQERAQEYDIAPARARWLLDAALVVADACDALHDGLHNTMPVAPALLALLAHLHGLISSKAYRDWTQTARQLSVELAALRYTVHIDGGTVTVRHCRDETDYAAEIAHVFARFNNPVVRDEAPLRDGYRRINHVHAAILERVALLFPEVFARLADFAASHADMLDPLLERFDREVRFYRAYQRLIAPLRNAGLAFDLPQMDAQDRQEHAEDTFDLALARQRMAAGERMVSNDLHLEAGERCIVVTGPNNGGKTTFARTFGQLHYLARLGLPVPGRNVRLFLCDAIHTHFERQEQGDATRGKLQDDLLRMRDILRKATPRSVVILNEVFSSTTANDALGLARRIMGQLAARGVIAVYVTFLTELSRFDTHTVSMVSTVDDDDPTARTFKIVRRAADGRSYAMTLAAKYGVTRAQLLERISP